jgi:hypothetical protein
VPRNSILDPDLFNLFFSDIDLTIVIQNDSDYLKILQHFIKLKKILIMFDLPEIYSEQDFIHLEKIKKGPHWGVIYTFWSIRKINWNLKSITDNASSFNKIKKDRSIKISLLKILNTEKLLTNYYYLSDFKYLVDFTSKGDKYCEFNSFFLETVHSSSIKLMLNEKEKSKFFSILPGEEYFEENMELKNSITNFEILITKTSVKIDEALGLNNLDKHLWIKKLEQQLG